MGVGLPHFQYQRWINYSEELSYLLDYKMASQCVTASNKKKSKIVFFLMTCYSLAESKFPFPGFLEELNSSFQLMHSVASVIRKNVLA